MPDDVAFAGMHAVLYLSVRLQDNRRVLKCVRASLSVCVRVCMNIYT